MAVYDYGPTLEVCGHNVRATLEMIKQLGVLGMIPEVHVPDYKMESWGGTDRGEMYEQGGLSKHRREAYRVWKLRPYTPKKSPRQ